MTPITPAFNTPTKIPYGTVNLIYGVPQGETPITCTAGGGTFAVEFGALSRLTGDPIFERTALEALDAIWQYKSEVGLVSLVMLCVLHQNMYENVEFGNLIPGKLCFWREIFTIMREN